MLESCPGLTPPQTLPSPSSHDLAPHTSPSLVVSQHRGSMPGGPHPRASPAKSLPHALRPALLPCRLFSIPGFSKAYFITVNTC